jgi:homoserine kinase
MDIAQHPTENKKIKPNYSAAGYVKVLAPGTVANLVCGFDVLGMCLNEPNDLMEVKLLKETKVLLSNSQNQLLIVAL